MKANKITLLISLIVILANTFATPITAQASSAGSLLAPATGPLRVHSANPRYFMDGSGNEIYLTGFHTWAILQDYGYSNPPPVFDHKAYLDYLQANGHNFVRFWIWEQTRWAPWTSRDIWFGPSPYQRTGPGNAKDGQPKFDLNKFNQAYFDRLRSRVLDAGNRGIYVSVMLFQGWSLGKKATNDLGNPWSGHPFNLNNNINGLNGDPNGDGYGYETHTLAVSAVTAQQKAYIRKVIDTVNDLDNVLYEISNESNGDSTAWQYEMINYIKSYEATKPKQHPVGMTVEYPSGSNADLFNSPADWISPNPGTGYQSNPPAANGNKVIISDTDHLWGIGGDRQWVWRSFTRGLNPIFMDCYQSIYCDGENPNDPVFVNVRQNLGYTLAYANRMNMAAMTPHGELCSSGFCLANPVGKGAEYLVYLPTGGQVSVNLSASPVEFMVEWLNPQNGTKVDGARVFGGNSQTFSAPFSGDAVLYLYNSGSAFPPPTPSSLPTSTPTNLPVVTPTNTAINIPTNTPIALPTNTPTSVPTNPPTNTPTATNKPADPLPTNTPANVPTSMPPATGVAPLPGQPRILTPQALTTRAGSTSGSLTALGILDQKDKEDDPSKYVAFKTPGQRYNGTLSYSLPADIPAGTVSELVLQINFKGTPSNGQAWTWGIYDWTNKRWVKAGGVTTGSNIRWQMLEFRLPFLPQYLSATNEIRVQLRSNNDLGDAKIDYQVLQVVSGSSQTSAAGMLAGANPTLPAAVTTNVEPTATGVIEMPASPAPEQVEPAVTETPLADATATPSP